jgi:transcriptional regulator with XRE-family HTH domain
MSLTPQQIRSAELLAKGHSQEAVGNIVGVSRRTIVRWLKREDFRNLSFGLLGRAAQLPQPSSNPLPESRKQSNVLTPQDLVGDALEAVRGILQDPDSRNSDRLKAAALVGDWVGLGDRERMHELEAMRVLIESGWLPHHVVDSIAEAAEFFELRAKEAFLRKKEPSSKQISSASNNGKML